MCLIGDSIPIVNRLALFTMRCQLSNVRITVSGLKGVMFCVMSVLPCLVIRRNVCYINVIKLLVFISCSRHPNALKKLLVTECSINDVTS